MPRDRSTKRKITDPGLLLATTHPLASGEAVRLRLTRPSDAPRIEAFLAGLSPASRARRFLEPTELTPELVRSFTHFNPRQRLAIAATLPRDGVEAIVGLADVTLAGTALAQLGVVVADEHQGQGVGTLLAQASAALALRRGATHLRVETLDGDGPLLRVMERLGRVARVVEDGRTIVYARIAGFERSAAA